MQQNGQYLPHHTDADYFVKRLNEENSKTTKRTNLKKAPHTGRA